MEDQINDHDVDEPDLVSRAGEIQKRAYMDKVWSMSKEKMFEELCLVHSESTRLLTLAQTEIDNLRFALAQHDKSRH